MTTEVEKFRRALELRNNSRTGVPANRPLRRIDLTPQTQTFLEAHQVPAEIAALLSDHSFDHHLTIGNHTFDSVNSLPSENLDDGQGRCIEARLLIIGSALNGDPIVVNLDTATVGFLLHDELWEDQTVAPRDIYTDTGLKIGSFYLAAAKHPDTFPADGYEAAEIGANPARFPV